jgi:SAM-dependent methyltransferase
MSVGGYEEGYESCDCFWGMSPGSLIQDFIETRPSLTGMRVLDLGCGEGKNAAAFARSGADVVAVDCSALALANGQKHFADSRIKWQLSDARGYLASCDHFDAIIMYGLLHCLPSLEAIVSTIEMALSKTTVGGFHFVVAFNDGPHDLAAHPNFSPILLPHAFYLQQYSRLHVLTQSNSLLNETHPHNHIPHFHSLTRIVARKQQ